MSSLHILTSIDDKSLASPALLVLLLAILEPILQSACHALMTLLPLVEPVAVWERQSLGSRQLVVGG